MRKTGSLNNHMQTRKGVCQEKIENEKVRFQAKILL